MSKIYVKNSTNKLKKVLLSPPDYLSLEPINVISERWIEKGEKVDREECIKEHKLLAKAYRDNDVEVIMMKPSKELPYQVFARDFGACIAEGYIAGRFREPVRKRELDVYEAKMKELGIPCVARCTAGAFEGGDFWFLDDYTMAQGIIARTDMDGVQNVRRQVQELGYEMIGVQCPKQNLHLDMCFNIVAPKVAVVCKEALPYNFLRLLEKRRFTLIEISQEDVFKHYGNIQALGEGRVLSCESNNEVNKKLTALGLKVVIIDLKNILKGGGGIHCMTFPLERE